MQTRNTTMIVQITTCDPSTRTVQGRPQDQSSPIGITVKDIPMAFRWPQVGEMWRIQQRSNNWYLQGRIALPSDVAFIEELNPGDAVIDSQNVVLQGGLTVKGLINSLNALLQGNLTVDGLISGNNAILQGDLTVNGLISGDNALQAGDLVPSVATSRPGALLCDGSPYDPIAHPNLFKVIGTRYGGTASAPLLPDFRGRLPLGAGTGTGVGATAWSLGEQPTTGPGGEQSHVQSAGELATHSHSMPSPFPYNGGGGVGTYSAGPYGFGWSEGTNDTGSSDPMNILPPVSVVNWFVIHGSVD